MSYLCINYKSAPNISNAIVSLRFPLAIFVVMQHVSPMLHYLPCDDYLSKLLFVRLFTELIPGVAVPTFYVISGYLFFFKIGKDYTKEQFIGQNIKRLKTLWLPFIYWNIIALIAIKLIPYFLFIIGLYSKPILSYTSFIDLILATFGLNGDVPVDGPLYFVRNLIIMCIFSPVVHFMIKRGGVFITGFILILWIFQNSLIEEPWGSMSKAVAFFMLGSYVGINRPNLVFLWNRGMVFCFVFLCLCVADSIVLIYWGGAKSCHKRISI